MTITPTDLKDYRMFYGLSQRAMAQLIGVSQTFVVMLESGERNIPDYLTDRLGLTAEQLENIRAVKAERMAMYPQYQK